MQDNTNNSPCNDYTEHVICNRFPNLVLSGKKAFDAYDTLRDAKVEIKSLVECYPEPSSTNDQSRLWDMNKSKKHLNYETDYLFIRARGKSGPLSDRFFSTQGKPEMTRYFVEGPNSPYVYSNLSKNYNTSGTFKNNEAQRRTLKLLECELT